MSVPDFVRRTLPSSGLLLAAFLTGCAAPPPTQVARTPPPAPAVGGLDGEYHGTATRFRADSRSCPRPGLVTLIVFDGKFQYRWDHDTWLSATVGPDGLAQAEEEGITLQGHAEGPLIEGDVSNGPCSFHFTVRKAGA